RNVAELGADRALSGPVRRGDAAAVGRHLEVLARGGGKRPVGKAALAYAALALAQIDLARALGEARPAALRTTERLAVAALAGARPGAPSRRGGRSRAT